MSNRAENYETGKKGESPTWAYLAAVGYVRPSAKQRANVVAAYKRCGLAVHNRGFDVVRAEVRPYLDSVAELVKRIDELRLFEVKTCGEARKAKVSPGYKGLGFTLTSKELENAKALGARYRFLFVNLLTRSPPGVRPGGLLRR